MAKVTISGVPPWDGEYPLDMSRLTNRELHRIKQLSGVRAGELGEALEAGDNDVLVSLAVIAMERAGVRPVPDDLWDAEFGQVEFDFDDEEDELEEDPRSGPRPVTPLPLDESGPGSSSGSSGDGSVNGGDMSLSGLPGTGGPGSEIAAA